MELKIIDELKTLIDPLTLEEFEGLKESILKEGCRDAIVLWAEQNVIIDGHNRYKICTDNNIEFKTVSISFDNIHEVKIWMINNQLSKRNVSPERQRYYRGLRYEFEKMSKGGTGANQHKQIGQNDPTAKKLAKEYGVSEPTIKRDAKFAKGVDLIDTIKPESKNEILSGKSELNITQVQEFGNIPKQAEKEVKQAAFMKTDAEIEAEIQHRAKEMAEEKLREIEEEKKNHFAKVANKIKTQETKEQSTINKNDAIDSNVNLWDVFLINGKHKLIIADSFTDNDFIQNHLPKIDCLLTDPPYGISYKSPSGSGYAQRGNYDIIEGDTIDFEPDILFNYCQNVITWGANNYANKMGNSPGWLVWDKRDGKAINLNSDCELAWTNMIKSARLFHHTWNGMIKASEHNSKRIHPTQKPVKLFEWCLEVTKAGINILDLFSGSGITLIACENTNRNAFLVEKDISYAAASLKRFESLNYKIEKI